MFKAGDGDWTQYRKLEPKPIEVDFHYSGMGRREIPYWEAMEQIRNEALEALKSAQSSGAKWVLFQHGASTSQGWKQATARSEAAG